jgi:hypothetical protein
VAIVVKFTLSAESCTRIAVAFGELLVHARLMLVPEAAVATSAEGADKLKVVALAVFG